MPEAAAHKVIMEWNGMERVRPRLEVIPISTLFHLKKAEVNGGVVNTYDVSDHVIFSSSFLPLQVPRRQYTCNVHR